MKIPAYADFDSFMQPHVSDVARHVEGVVNISYSSTTIPADAYSRGGYGTLTVSDCDVADSDRLPETGLGAGLDAGRLGIAGALTVAGALLLAPALLRKRS